MSRGGTSRSQAGPAESAPACSGKILTYLNTFYQSIKFPIVIGGPTINFLDFSLSLHMKPIDSAKP